MWYHLLHQVVPSKKLKASYASCKLHLQEHNQQSELQVCVSEGMDVAPKKRCILIWFRKKGNSPVDGVPHPGSDLVHEQEKKAFDEAKSVASHLCNE